MTERNDFVLQPLRSNSQLETVRPEVPERDRPAPGTETQPAEEESLALMPKARPHPGPSGEPEESPELQALVVGGSPVVQEQTLEASAPAAPEPQDGTQASPSLKSLEEVSEVSAWVPMMTQPVRSGHSCSRSSVLSANVRAFAAVL